MYREGKIGLGILAYVAKTDSLSFSIYEELARKSLSPLEVYNEIMHMCENRDNARRDNYAAMENAASPAHVKFVDLANELPLLVISSSNTSYYIVVKLGEADVAVIRSIVASLSG